MEMKKNQPMEMKKNQPMEMKKKDRLRIGIALNEEKGSLNILIIGLFVITVACLMVMTDVATIMMAKRSLTQATEAAAIRGVHTLDRASYYTGKGTMLTTPLALASNRDHPAIPIDCGRAPFDIALELQNWSSDNTSMTRPELQHIVLSDFACDGSSLEISTFAEVKFPFTIPFTTMKSAFLTSSAGSTNQVQEGFYVFGIRLH